MKLVLTGLTHLPKISKVEERVPPNPDPEAKLNSLSRRLLRGYLVVVGRVGAGRGGAGRGGAGRGFPERAGLPGPRLTK